MRKFLIMILVAILLAGLCVIMLNGITIGNFEIPSIKEIIADNDNLDYQISVLSTTIDTDYVIAQRELSTSVNELEETKQEYLDIITYSTEEELKTYYQTDEYEISYLWTRIGLYATDNELELTMNVTESTLPGLYNLSFKAIGEYLPISEFIYSIENDSEMGFRIDNFELIKYEEEEENSSNSSSNKTTTTDEEEEEENDDLLQVSFEIKNISLNEESLIQAVAETTADQTEDTVE